MNDSDSLSQWVFIGLWLDWKKEVEVLMAYKGVVKGNVVELEGDAVLPDGTRVSVIPEPSSTVGPFRPSMNLKAWLREARRVREQLPKAADSVNILQQLRDRRVSR